MVTHAVSCMIPSAYGVMAVGTEYIRHIYVRRAFWRYTGTSHALTTQRPSQHPRPLRNSLLPRQRLWAPAFPNRCLCFGLNLGPRTERRRTYGPRLAKSGATEEVVDPRPFGTIRLLPGCTAYRGSVGGAARHRRTSKAHLLKWVTVSITM